MELQQAHAALPALSDECQEGSWLNIRELDDCFIMSKRISLEGAFVQSIIDGSAKINIRVADDYMDGLSRWGEPDRTEIVNKIATGLDISGSDIANTVSIELMSSSSQLYLYTNFASPYRSLINIDGSCVSWSRSMVLDLIIRIKRKFNLPVKFERVFL